MIIDMTTNRPGPESGDLLVARPTASNEYELMIVPSSESVMHGRYGRAIILGLELSQERGVDLWLTEDHIHYVRLAAHRSAPPASGESSATG